MIKCIMMYTANNFAASEQQNSGNKLTLNFIAYINAKVIRRG